MHQQITYICLGPQLIRKSRLISRIIIFKSLGVHLKILHNLNEFFFFIFKIETAKVKKIKILLWQDGFKV